MREITLAAATLAALAVRRIGLTKDFEKKSWRYWAGTGATNSNRAAWIILEIF